MENTINSGPQIDAQVGSSAALPNSNGNTAETPPLEVTMDGANKTACNCHKRPFGLPDKFWDAKNKKVRVKSLLQSYLDAEKQLSVLQQEKPVFETSVSSMQTDYPCCPATAEDYQIIVDNGVFDNDPTINQILHEAGFSNEQAQLVYDLAELELLPAAQELGRRYRMDHDIARLEQHFGGKARWREASRQIRNWATKNLPDHAYEALSSSYEGILAMHAMIDRKEEPDLLSGEAQKDGLEEKDLRRMMQDPKYWQERDPTIVHKVSEGFKRLYGN